MEKKSKKRIFINALYQEEKRVAIVEGDKLVDFYVELSGKEHLKGNIYKGVVAKIEPGIQAAFVDFGQKKHGFLQLKEISMESFRTQGGKGGRPRIQEVLHKGQEIIVQVERDERDTKGASLTTFISIPGRYMVMMPGQSRLGISRKIETPENRDRLKEIFSSLKVPENTGFILRTAGGDKSKRDLSQDLKYLMKLWDKIRNDSEKTGGPALIYKEHDIALRTVRDYLTSDVEEVVIDQEDAYRDVKVFLRNTLPWRRLNVRLYREKDPLFSRYKLDSQIEKINERNVYLPSGGYLCFDKTEALTAVDINSGRSRKENGVEATALRTNLEAAEEIARQLRLRDIGGLIAIDFIDLASAKHRSEVERKFAEALKTDKANTETTGISKFGILEMTRERLRPAYGESMYRKCESCGGSGLVKRDEMLALAALREIHMKISSGGIKSINCNLPVASLNYLINTKREELNSIEQEFGIPVWLHADVSLQAGKYVVETEKAEPALEKRAS